MNQFWTIFATFIFTSMVWLIVILSMAFSGIAAKYKAAINEKKEEQP